MEVEDTNYCLLLVPLLYHLFFSYRYYHAYQILVYIKFHFVNT